ncbi:MAG: bifunctional diguanylate cyclase/phosphodiesterase [Oscillospiraceae bacterium]|nr:bifunctional diguanylate cyclase/phosphodiesterase [Oscillospiraceae bacterium]
MLDRTYEQTLIYYIRTMMHAPEEAKLSVDDLPEELKPLGEALRSLGESILMNQSDSKVSEQRAHVDELTGAWDKTYAIQALEETLSRGVNYVIGMIVLDDLDECINRFGQVEGDRFIQTAYHILEDTLPRDTFLFRTGNDRFMAMSVSMPLEAIELTLSSARKQIQDSSRRTLEYQRSFSFGCAFANAKQGGSYKVYVDEAKRNLKRCRLAYLAEKSSQTDNGAAIDNVDPVTGLFNIYRLMDELRRFREERRPVSLMIIGANQFRNINKSYGFDFGNKVLRLFADQILQLIQSSGRVFRLNGVKFCVLIEHLCQQEELERLYAKICDIAKSHLCADDQMVSLTISGGSLSFQRIEQEENAIMAELEYAMSLSKKENMDKLIYFDDSLHRKANRQLDLIDTLIHSVIFNDFHGFFLEYQPQVCNDGRVIGAEALVRWQDNEWGRVPPNDFIPILENDRCFYKLGLWILQTAMREMRPVIDKHPDFSVSVNVSYRQMERPHFKTDVLAMIKRMGFPAGNLTLELTEHCRTIRQDVLIDNLDFLRAAGIRISADDFGTGYSSLAMLRDLPFDMIKIDRMFIHHIMDNNTDRIIVNHTIRCAKDFGIGVCIEGVEDVPTLLTLEDFQPDYYQGYLYSRPIPTEQLLSLCLEHEEPRINIETNAEVKR